MSSSNKRKRCSSFVLSPFCKTIFVVCVFFVIFVICQLENVSKSLIVFLFGRRSTHAHTHMSETRKEAEAEAEESSSSVGGWGFSLPSIELPTDLSSLTDTLSSAVRELETKADEAYSQMKGITEEAMKNTLEQAEMMAEEEEKEKNKDKYESRGDTRQEIEEEKELEEEEKRRREEKATKQKEEAKKKAERSERTEEEEGRGREESGS